jgi:hypothetical protein
LAENAASAACLIFTYDAVGDCREAFIVKKTTAVYCVIFADYAIFDGRITSIAINSSSFPLSTVAADGAVGD